MKHSVSFLLAVALAGSLVSCKKAPEQAAANSSEKKAPAKAAAPANPAAPKAAMHTRSTRTKAHPNKITRALDSISPYVILDSLFWNEGI